MSWVATALVVSATVLNLVVLGLIYWLFRQIRVGPWANLWYRDPPAVSELALSMQLEALQVLLIVIGIGLTGLGVFGFKSIQDEARKAAEKAAAEAAEKAAAEAAEKATAEAVAEAAVTAEAAAAAAVDAAVDELVNMFLDPDELDDLDLDALDDEDDEDWQDPFDPAGE